MSNNSIKYLHSINSSQLTLTKETDSKNFHLATAGLVIFQSSSSRTHTDIRKLNPAIYMLNVSCWIAAPKETLY